MKATVKFPAKINFKDVECKALFSYKKDYVNIIFDAGVVQGERTITISINREKLIGLATYASMTSKETEFAQDEQPSSSLPSCEDPPDASSQDHQLALGFDDCMNTQDV